VLLGLSLHHYAASRIRSGRFLVYPAPRKKKKKISQHLNRKVRGIGPQTVRRYSIARCGLLYAALIARSICVLSKPIDSISAIAAALCSPNASAEGSMKSPPPADAGAGAAGVGDCGAAAVALGAARGAGGGTGVEATAGAGVDGAFAGVVEAGEMGAAALGYNGPEHPGNM
jgi:hypothetical protein